MAGIDWFRWHHGSVNDPKFQLIARKTKASVAEVIAVWATLLEAASMSERRGDPGSLDFESIDCALGLEEGQSKMIHSAMIERGIINEDGISSWDKRQPKRERDDDNSTERSRAYRQRKAEQEHAIQPIITPCHTNENHATPCNATQRQETPRVEKSREELTPTVYPTSSGQPREATTRKGLVCGLLRKAGMADAAPHYLTDETWEAILSKRSDDEIIEVAIAKMAARPGQRTGLKYIAPILIQDPEPITANARASPPGRRKTLTETRTATIAALTGKNRNERPSTEERDITGESIRIA